MSDTPKKKIKARSIGRALAFQALYQEELNPLAHNRDWEELYDYYCVETKIFPSDDDRVEALKFAQHLFQGEMDRREEVDQIISAALDKRTLKHTTVVDRNILRVAAYEMRFIKTPKAIVISEAIELGKRFGDRGSCAFLNGVLDQVDSIQLAKPAYVVAEPSVPSTNDAKVDSNESVE